MNKLRTTLSLLGVMFGILCIIGVLTAVNSMERNIQNEVKTLGSNTIYIDKWDYSGGPDQPIWKFRARPTMKYEEMNLLKQRSQLSDDIAYLMQSGGSVTYKDQQISGAIYGVVPAQMNIQPITLEAGRFFSDAEFNAGTNSCIIGFTSAEDFFGNAERAIGKQVELKGKKATVVGVIKKEGKNFIGWDYDNCIMLPYRFCRTVIEEKWSNPILIAKGKEGVTTDALLNELKGAMRQIRLLAPRQEDNFSLNSVEAFSKAISGFFSTVNIVGWFIGIICLIVGLFGIANIMFVTVKERTPMIGLKKALGAKSSSILFEFLMESVIICLIGGAMGVLLVYLLSIVATKAADFPIFISVPLIILAFIICVIVGILAGLVPARRASKMDPVAAIRSK